MEVRGIIEAKNALRESIGLHGGMIQYSILSVIDLGLVENNLQSQLVKLCGTGQGSYGFNVPYEVIMETWDYCETPTWRCMLVNEEEDLGSLNLKGSDNDMTLWG